MRLVRLPRWSSYDCLFREGAMRGTGDCGRLYPRAEVRVDEL